MAEPKELPHDEIAERVSAMSDNEIQEIVDGHNSLFGRFGKTQESYLTGQIAVAERAKRLDQCAMAEGRGSG